MANIKGTIIDSATSKPVDGAQIVATYSSTLSDASGNFTLATKANDGNKLRVLFPDYHMKEITIDPGKDLSLGNVKITQDADADVAEVLIVADRVKKPAAPTPPPKKPFNVTPVVVFSALFIIGALLYNEYR